VSKRVATAILVIIISRIIINDVEEEMMMRSIDPVFILKVTKR